LRPRRNPAGPPRLWPGFGAVRRVNQSENGFLPDSPSGAAPDALCLISGRIFSHFSPCSLPKCARSTSLSRQNRLISPPYHANTAGKRRFCACAVTLRAHLACGRVWPKSRGWLKRRMCRNPVRFTARCRVLGPRCGANRAVNGFLPGSPSGAAPDAQ
jgi:hypothetical protein